MFLKFSLSGGINPRREDLSLLMIYSKEMEKPQIEKTREENLKQISPEEEEVIHDIREVNFGRVVIFVQNGNIISKEITKTVKKRKIGA